MQIKTDGLIIKNLNVGEADRIVTILTREKGVVRASARGARRVNSRLSTATRLFCYSDFTLFKSREKYIIDDAQPLEFFMGLDENLEKLALAQYFAQLDGFLAPEEESAGLYLRLLLNALHLIANSSKPLRLVKAVFELRILTMAGYMPDIVACKNCGSYEDDIMYLDPLSGTLLCSHCAENEVSGEKIAVTKGTLAAMRHAIYADFSKIFSFSLPKPAINEFADASQKYLLNQIERSFPTLDFYNEIASNQ